MPLFHPTIVDRFTPNHSASLADSPRGLDAMAFSNHSANRFLPIRHHSRTAAKKAKIVVDNNSETGYSCFVMNIEDAHIAESLKQYRRDRLATLVEIAKATGLTVTTLHKIETRKTNPSLLTTGRLLRLPGFSELLETTKEA